ncbi:ParB N-terminal domain-containing protein [Pedococcus ginsenosidimutans]
MVPVIRALQTMLSDGTKSFPIYLGYLAADQLKSVAEVPSFNPNSGNADIARNVLNPPIKNWQRPVIPEKWQAIRDKFSQPGELMPNPVLLAVADVAHVHVRQQILNGQATEVFEISVNVPAAQGSKPLWILDGQHRVEGVSQSTNSSNPIPLVLLHGEASQAYSPAQFAKVFAEVTTYATPLHELHEHWLQYAFKLGAYQDAAGGTSTSEWKAMTTVAMLCEHQNVGPSHVTNPFYDKVQFNPDPTKLLAAAGGGFSYTSLGLKEIVLGQYFSRPGSSLGPAVVADQIALAVLALSRNVTTPTTDSAFFGDASHRQKYLMDAYLVGVLTYLLKHGVPTDWDSVLQALKFNASNWDVTGWVQSTGGNFGNVSRRVANKVFEDMFAKGALGVSSDIPSWLAGDGAELTLLASDPGRGGARRNRLETVLPINGTKPLNIGAARRLKLVGHSINVGNLRIVDESRPLGNEFNLSSLKRGVILPQAPGSLRLLVGAEYYGGSRSQLKINITWS